MIVVMMSDQCGPHLKNDVTMNLRLVEDIPFTKHMFMKHAVLLAHATETMLKQLPTTYVSHFKWDEPHLDGVVLDPAVRALIPSPNRSDL